jgi:antitoxin component of MazEF toxin-antitoxin module
MVARLNRWGNSLGLRLPNYVIERTGLRAGDPLFIRLTDAGVIVIKPVNARDIPAGYLPDDSPPRPTIPVEEEKW